MTIPYPPGHTEHFFRTVTPPSSAARPRLAFIGTGYLGATYADCFAELGYEVMGFDIDASKATLSTRGVCRFTNPDSNDYSNATWTPAGYGSPPVMRKPLTSVMFTSSVSALRSAATV